MSDEVSPGELNRRIDTIERMIDRRFAENETRMRLQFDGVHTAIREQNSVHKDVYIVDMGNIQKRLQALEDRNQRVVGWIVTGAVLPILVVIIVSLLQLN